jgi:hypothetical protein
MGVKKMKLQKQGKSTSQWKKGESGNPAGRKPGTGEVTKLRNSIAEHIPEIINNLVEAAKSGDIQSAKLLLDRVVPSLKAVEPTVELAMPPGTASDQSRALLIAVEDGVISISQGIQLMSGIELSARLAKNDKIEKENARLDAKYSFDL